MSFPSDRGSRKQRATRRSPRRAVRAVLAVLMSLGLLSVAAACGNDAQTLKPYTPAEGINVDVGGTPSDLESVVHVRNLLIISKEPGVGVLSASLMTYGRDQLSSVSGKPIKIDATEGAPFTANVGSTVTLANGVQVVLTDGAPITVRSPDIAPGLSATVTLTFATAGETTVTVPIADGKEPQYASITPAPAPSGTPA